jgi:hypothetical protein
MGIRMNFKGTVSVDGDTGDPLPVTCEITDTRLILTAQDGSVIGSWLINDLPVVQTADGVVLKVDGEKLRIVVRKPESFAKALGTTGTSGVARRVAKARQTPDDSDRIRPLLAVGLLVGLAVASAIGLWVTDSPPFASEPPVTVAAAIRTVPPTTRLHVTSTSSGGLTKDNYIRVAAGAMAVSGRDGEFQNSDYANWAIDTCSYLGLGASWADAIRDLTVRIGFDGADMSTAGESFAAAILIGQAAISAYCPTRTPSDGVVASDGRRALRAVTDGVVLLSVAIEQQANTVDLTFASEGENQLYDFVVDAGVAVCRAYRRYGNFEDVLEEVENSLDEWPRALQRTYASAPARYFCPRFAHLLP